MCIENEDTNMKTITQMNVDDNVKNVNNTDIRI